MAEYLDAAVMTIVVVGQMWILYVLSRLMPSLAETPNNNINTFVFQLYIVHSVGLHCCLFNLLTC